MSSAQWRLFFLGLSLLRFTEVKIVQGNCYIAFLQQFKSNVSCWKLESFCGTNTELHALCGVSWNIHLK